MVIGKLESAGDHVVIDDGDIDEEIVVGTKRPAPLDLEDASEREQEGACHLPQPPYVSHQLQTQPLNFQAILAAAFPLPFLLDLYLLQALVQVTGRRHLPHGRLVYVIMVSMRLVLPLTP